MFLSVKATVNAFPIIAMVKYADIQCCVVEVKYYHTDFVNFWKGNQESAIASSQIQKQCSAFSSTWTAAVSRRQPI
jgi:hypothetical protein